MTGGEAIVRMLKNEGVTTVFGIIDGTYFGLYSKFKKYGIEFITPRHETSAVHMAGAYARLTGKLGVCIASNGPGVANALPGVAVENAEGNRVLLITSSRRNPIIYPDRGGSYQCFNQVGVIKQMSKYSEYASIPERIPEILKQAFRMCYKGRPGVVHVDVPENYMNGKTDFDEAAFQEPARYRKTEAATASKSQLARAAKMLAAAKSPVIHTGSGIIHALAFEELEKVADLLYAPVTTSWGARGALCENNELSVPMIYVGLNDEIRSNADLILTLGSRLGETDRWGMAPHWGHPATQKMIQVDIDEEYLGRNKPTDLAILADVKVFLSELYDELRIQENTIDKASRKRIWEPFLKMKKKERETLDKHLADLSVPMNTAHVADICKQVFEEDAIAVFDGGNTSVWGQFYYKCTKPGSGISTPKMGMLGAGVGQAIGAAVAFRDKQVYCIIGDGAMGFHPQEIETAIRNNCKIIYLVVSDRQWGMVKMNQQFALRPLKTLIKKSLDEDETINADLGEIAWDKLAESMGAYGERVADPQKLKDAILRCLNAGRCAVIHVDVDPVKHMWAPSLMHFKKMHEEPKGK
ncbi:MAG: thiamine pyrophosphate-binding protein [Sphingobacteriales bacterium]|jgi:acetolactate synthase-1/2/3 large subunit|nr:thiamine pyrophosphate-binding protein [Sphingobacteriales bacterium]